MLIFRLFPRLLFCPLPTHFFLPLITRIKANKTAFSGLCKKAPLAKISVIRGKKVELSGKVFLAFFPSKYGKISNNYIPKQRLGTSLVADCQSILMLIQMPESIGRLVPKLLLGNLYFISDQTLKSES
jgi:hypothetical protein